MIKMFIKHISAIFNGFKKALSPSPMSRYAKVAHLVGNKKYFDYLKFSQMEDSLILTNYPADRNGPRRVWKIDTGIMPEPKAEAYIKKIRKELSRRVDYDTESGQCSSI